LNTQCSASDNLNEANALLRGKGNAKAVRIDVSNKARVEELVREADVIVRFEIRSLLKPHSLTLTICSLLPAPFHPSIAKLCIMHQKHMLTASYISPDMKALDKRCAFS
jgi:alpha-aminoadipic semialdehyde synthase